MIISIMSCCRWFLFAMAGFLLANAGFFQATEGYILANVCSVKLVQRKPALAE